MRLSSFKMPRWWQHCWRARYPMGPDGHLRVYVGSRAYRVRPMACGCGYTVRYVGGEELPGHWPTLGAAIRAARKDAPGRARRLHPENVQ